MELQVGLNNVVRERIANRIQSGSMNAQRAVAKLIEEGKVSQDYIAYLGANGTRHSEISYGVKQLDENTTLQMVLPRSQMGEYSLHDNAIGQLAEKFDF